MIYQISFFPFNFFYTSDIPNIPNIRVLRKIDYARTIECKNEIWTNY